MKHNLIKTDNYLLVVDDSEIKEGDYFYRDSGVVLILTKELLEYYKSIKDSDIHKRYKIISHAPLNGAPYLDGVDRLPPIEDDVDKFELFLDNEVALNLSPKNTIQRIKWYYQTYFKAREKYKYTERDVRAIKRILIYDDDKNDAEKITEVIRVIESLQQPKIPIAFECEMEPKFKHIGSTKEVKGSGSRIKNKHAGNPKTFINSEGRTEWVGKYIYE